MTIGELRKIIMSIPDKTMIYLKTGEESSHDIEIGSIFYREENRYRYPEIFFVVDYLNDIELFENFVGDKCLYSDTLQNIKWFPKQLKDQRGIILINGNVVRASGNRIKMLEAVGEEYVLALEKELGHMIQ